MPGIRWEAPEFEHRPKTAGWYWTTVVIAVVLLALAIWQKSFLFALFIIIAEVLVIVWGAIEPPTVKFELTDKGLRVGERRYYPMRELHSFSADSEGILDPAYPEVVIRFRHHFRTPLRIKAPMSWLPEVRRELQAHIPEEHFEPGMTEVLERYLGF
jgi:hypothetical protein